MGALKKNLMGLRLVPALGSRASSLLFIPIPVVMIAASAKFPVAAAVALAGLAQFFLVHAGGAQFSTVDIPVRMTVRIDAQSARTKFKGLRLHREGSHQ